MSKSSVIQSYEAAHDKWQMCDWPTQFGVLKLNLMGLRSFHADRLAAATGGQESREWRNAAAWLRKIETDAARAQQLATLAKEASLQNDHLRAIQLINESCQLEAAWHEKLIWDSLAKAVATESSAIH